MTTEQEIQNKPKKVKATKVEVVEKPKTEETAEQASEEKKPNVIKRGINALGRDCTALQSIFASIGQMVMGKKKPHWLARATAGFLTILGWLFFSVAFTPALASAACEVGAQKLTYVETVEATETATPEEEACSEESSEQ